MSFYTYMRWGHPILFSLIILFCIIELWLTSRFNVNHSYFSLAERDRTRFLLFASLWTIIFSGLYMLFFFYLPDSDLSSVASHFVFLFLTWIFWSAGAFGITTVLTGGLNNNNQCVVMYCSQLSALNDVAWIIWFLVTFAVLVVIIRGILAVHRMIGSAGH
ncbi:hypothetical protein EDB19DRAFT_1894719 [Suillus lakei]|nr:hypothetical protein EDB19DRAFT_1894719 [Suillus lakei]